MTINETTISGFRPSPDPAPPDLIGRQLGHYNILEKLGEGGMGEVYLAEDGKLGRRVAIKVLPERIAKRRNSLERFSREASAVGALNHPNIVTIHGLEEADGLQLIVMELVEGETLADMLPEEGLAADAFLSLALPLAEAVAAAHARGVVHRDIKPANIMVNADGRVKVVDFGLAKLRPDLAASKEQATLTREGHLVGTVTYMSPEQLRGEPADARSDVFSLGTVLYEMATGHHPFDGDTQPVIISSILCQDPREITSVREAFPARIGKIIDRCLHKEPDQRYADAGALHQALVALKQKLDEERILNQARGHRAPLLRRALIGLLATAAVLAAGMGAWHLYGPKDTADRPLTLGVRPLSPAVEPTALPTVAVLHFRNLRDDPELEWLHTGLTEMLTTDLAQSTSFRVLSSEQTHEVLSAIKAPDGSGPEANTVELIRAVAERASATAVVSGSFFRAADSVQIAYKLHDTATGEVLLTKRLEARDEAHLFSMVDELSRGVRSHLERATSAGANDRDLETVTTTSVEAYRYYVEGRNLRMQSKLHEAVPLLEKAVELDPQFAMAWARLAVVQRALGELSEAQRCFERAIAHVDRLPERERFYVEGQYYSDQRATYGQAITALRRAIEIDPNHQSARYTLASLLTYLDRIEEARVHVEFLRDQRSSIASSGVFLAYVHAVQNDEPGVFSVLKAARDRDPSWFNLGVLGWYQAIFFRLDEARATLSQAEALRPGTSHLANIRREEAILRRDWDEAKRQAQATIKAGDGFGLAVGHIGMAYVHQFRGNPDAALRHFQTNPDEGDEDHRAAAQRAVRAAEMLLQVDRADEALSWATGAVRDAPTDWSGRIGLYLMALARQQLGQPAMANQLSDQFRELVEAEVSQIESRYALHLDGQLAHFRGDLAAAQVALVEAEKLLLPRGINWQIPPDHIAIWWSLGQNARAMGDLDQALFWFKRIVDSTSEQLVDPIRYVRSHFELGRLYSRRGEDALAREAFEQFLDFWEDGAIDRDAVAIARDALR